MRRMTVAKTIREREHEMRRREILKAFETITREEVLEMVKFYEEKGILKVTEQKSQVRIDMNRCCSSWNFYDKVMGELHRTCIRCNSTYNCWGHEKTTTYTIADGTVKIYF